MQDWSFRWGVSMGHIIWGASENSEKVMEYGIRKCAELTNQFL